LVKHTIVVNINQ